MLGVIGGSGLYRLEGFELLEEIYPETPFGYPSAPIRVGLLDGKKVAFLARHGLKHEYPPHRVPYRANLWAFYKLGVKRVLGVFAVGGINPLLRPGEFGVLKDFIEFTKSRPSTYYEGKFSVKVEGEGRAEKLLREGKVVHVDLTEPYCPETSRVLEEALSKLGLSYRSGVVYACTEGPRFETPAEIRFLKLAGADVVGMTGYPEVVLARELELCYAALCVVANPAAGLAGYRLTSDEVISMMKEREEQIKRVVGEVARLLPAERACSCGRALEGAVV
ncbi:MAG: S-methyl-5'-thioadenosine phosphorylase [Aquificae bacterium]|nr:S-methyl-5'-thioadenosine phosphorylase [Aquificota bacterium]